MGPPGDGAGPMPSGRRVDATLDDAGMIERAEDARADAGTAIGLAVHVLDQGDDAVASIAVVTPARQVVERRTVFLGGANGRIRAALAAASVLLAASGPTRRPPEALACAR